MQYLTEANVLHYLLERRFASLEAVVDGGFTVRRLSRRNNSFHVTCGRRAYLVKQVKIWDAQARSTLEREAAFHWRSRTDSHYHAVAPLIPQPYAWDPANSILIFNWLAGYSELHDSRQRFSPDLARLMAATMAFFHRHMAMPRLTSVFPAGIPQHLAMHEMKEEELIRPSEGRREVIRVVQKHSGFGDALDELRAAWQADTVIHGDWKLENCLIPAEGNEVRMVDWEFAQWGDSRWDAGTLMQSLWLPWVRRPATCRLEEIRPALCSFLSNYVLARGWELSEAVPKIIRFAAARMLQTAWEATDEAAHITADAVRLTQASLNILTRPEWAIEQLLGPEWMN